MKSDFTIAYIKELINNEQFTEEQYIAFQKDSRKGVQKLLEQYEKKQKHKRALQHQFEEMQSFEKHYFQEGKQYIAGIDEAGRGPLAGPVVAAAVILPIDFHLVGLNDSKQLTGSNRNLFFESIKQEAISYGIGVIPSEVIDELNIHQATKLAMRKALSQLDPFPDHVLIDAVELTDISVSYDALIKGDTRSISIAAASVLAKVTRDRYMETLHNAFPEYQFGNNMGYGTKEHMQAIQEHGITQYHRRSFSPVRKAIYGGE
ncbi:ribonuclease HII [Pontibacillus yanchengensis]|uniref:Ribonuclease HII n=2 Tax=Pontibacillus yanchengensis TaxID=462910 RepID=A0ACC7VBK2_9BACI|nr:ribonuclease HII [Pontibacillus yanchengensis]MYL33125.1 ribonuclease HII [Pontibacillus yanchengensis]MYL52025.1 ribonuclease HII [Pontibacillus yanchengensis]